MPIPHVLPQNGPISFQQIEDEFGGSHPITMPEYYGASPGIPESGTISASDFYGTSSEYNWCAYHPTASNYHRTVRADRTGGVAPFDKEFGWMPDQSYWDGNAHQAYKGHFYKVSNNQVLRYAYTVPSDFYEPSIIPIGGKYFLLCSRTTSKAQVIRFDWDANPKVVLGVVMTFPNPTYGNRTAFNSFITENLGGGEDLNNFKVVQATLYAAASSSDDSIVAYQAHRVSVNSGILASGPKYQYPEGTPMPRFGSHKSSTNTSHGFHIEGISTTGLYDDSYHGKIFLIIDSHENITKSQVIDTSVGTFYWAQSGGGYGTVGDREMSVCATIGFIEVNSPESSLLNVGKVSIPTDYFPLILHLTDGCLTMLAQKGDNTISYFRSYGSLSGFSNFALVSSFQVPTESGVQAQVNTPPEQDYMLMAFNVDQDAPRSVQAFFTT